MRRSAPNLLLCLLVLVGSTSLSVRHAHAHGGQPHTHGYGPAVLCPSTGTTGCGGRHEHILLCGVEFYHPGGLDGDAPTDPDSAPQQVNVGFGDACDSRAESGAGTTSAAPLPTLFTPTTAPSPRLTPVPTGRRLPFLELICDSARRVRSGVLTV